MILPVDDAGKGPGKGRVIQGPWRRFSCVAAGLLLLTASAGAQQLIAKGEYGMKAGTQPPPGVYAGMFGSFFWTDTFKAPDGDSVKGSNAKEEVFGPLVVWVSCLKILGADYEVVSSMGHLRDLPLPTILRSYGTT